VTNLPLLLTKSGLLLCPASKLLKLEQTLHVLQEWNLRDLAHVMSYLWECNRIVYFLTLMRIWSNFLYIS